MRQANRKEAGSSKGFDKFLNIVERLGNALPNPVMIFVWLCVIVMVLSHVFHLMGMGVTFIRGGIEETVYARSLFSGDGIRHLFVSPVNNFITFPPLGVVVVCMLGVGVAEASGMIGAMIKRFVMIAPKWSLTYAIMLLGIISSVATDAGYLVLIPLSAAVFHAMGRNPLAGIAVSFAGVSASFGANLMISPLDGILAGLTEAAAQIMEPGREVTIVSNYYFSIVSTVMMTLVGAWVTTRLIEPRLGQYDGQVTVEDQTLTDAEKKGLRYALFGFLATAVAILALVLPAGAPLRHQVTGEILTGSPFLSGIVFVVFVMFLIPGIAYGVGAKTIKGSNDVIKYAQDSMTGLSSFFVLAFVVGTFLSFFTFSELGTLLAVSGANGLQALGLGTIPLLILFVLFSGFVNLLIGSMSAKYALLAPIFVPMFMQLGIVPELTQAAFRVGDGVTNIITPLMTYFPLILVFVQKYKKDAGVGTVIAMMIPYSIWLLISWLVLLVVFYVFSIPLGPAVVMHM